MEVFYGIMIPFLGTSLGAASALLMKGQLLNKTFSNSVHRALSGFAAGVNAGVAAANLPSCAEP